MVSEVRGGERGAFPETNWPLIREAREGGSTGLGSLIGQYWKPVCAYIRRFRGVGPEESEDLTQDFFVRWVEGNLIRRADPHRGSFRGYLLAAVRNYVLNRFRDLHARKRGGGRTIVSLGVTGEETIEAPGCSLEKAADLALLKKIFQEAYCRLEEHLRAEGRGGVFEMFRRHDLQATPGPRPSYDDLAFAFGLTVHEVRDRLRHARELFRRKVLQCIAELMGAGKDPECLLRQFLERA